MSLARWAKKRDANEGALVKLARKLGAGVWLLDRPADLLVCFRSRWFVCEVKTEDGDLNPSQQEFLRDALENGGRVEIWRTQDDVMRTLGAL